MNKLASMIYLENLGLLKTPFYIVNPEDESLEYLRPLYSSGQWAVRSADRPNLDAEKEIGLPWNVADSVEELLTRIKEVRAKASGRVVMIHKQREFGKVGGLRISPTSVEVEGFNGEMSEHWLMLREKEASVPQQFIFSIQE